MKRLFLLIIISLFLTGCKVEYNLTLDDKLNLLEDINVISSNEKDKESLANFSYNIPIDATADDYDVFEKKIETLKYYNIDKNNDKMKINYKYNNTKYDEYNNSMLVNMAYEYISVSKINDKELTLSTSKEFMLFNDYDTLEEVKITIETNYKVLSNNADEVNRHKYIWHLTRDNAYGKGIYLKVDTSIEELTFFEKLLRGDYFNTFTISLFILIIGSIIYIFLKNKSNNIDKI